MNITKYSRNHFYRTLADWEVPQEYANVMFDYFVNGFHPGSFFSAVPANDFAGAMTSSHPANSITGLKNLVGWLRSTMTYGKAWGTPEAVQSWLHQTQASRRAVLEEFKLIFSEQEEIVKALKNERSVEPMFF